MKISVITIVYNDVAHIERTINNVIGQSARNDIEYIIVDGASTDGTSDIINRYRDKIDRYICEPDTGIYNAMNKGMKAASGDYVMFINSGDRLSSITVLQEIIRAIGNDTPDVVYGSYREVNDDGKESSVIPCRKFCKIWYGPVASHQSTLYRLEHLRHHNLTYDETYKIAADYKLTTQAITLAKSISQTDICISDFDITGVSSTNQNLGLKEANKVRREVLHWNRLQTSLLTCLLYGARYFKRYCNPIYNVLRY